jgi:hypothetical protein
LFFAFLLNSPLASIVAERVLLSLLLQHRARRLPALLVLD